MLCFSYFQWVRQRTSSTLRMIPGLVDIDRITKITYQPGMC